jgi:uncharacterized protein (DUF3084 family)
VTFVGRPLNLAVVVAIVVLAAGTVGATALYQSGVAEVETQNDRLRAQNEQLREDLASARERIDGLETRVESLRAQLSARNETLETVRSERDTAQADLRSVCEEVRDGNVTLPEECADVG